MLLNEYNINFTVNNLRNSRSSTDKTRLCVPHCRTEAGKQVYFNRIVSLWNNVPNTIREVSYFNVFKRLIFRHFRERFRDMPPNLLI